MDDPAGETAQPVGRYFVTGHLLRLTQITPRPVSHRYTPAWWLPGGHLRTLWGKFLRRDPLPPSARRERWETPDDDFVDVVRLDGRDASAPRLVLTHGLEGTARSHYVRGFFGEAARRGWGADLLVFRGCGDELNRARRFYHSGETTDLAHVVARVAREYPRAPLGLAGVSLGGNVLLKLLGERGRDSGASGEPLPAAVRAAAAVSVPYDLGRGARYIGRGFGAVYERSFLKSLRRKAAAKLERYPDLYDPARLAAARTILEFDDAVTAPLHGFAGADDYYDRSSSIHFLADIRVPTLLLSAVDDPFLPPAVLDEVRAVARTNPLLELEFVQRGGHVGFISGRVPWRPFYYAEWRVCEFLAEQLEA